MWMTINEGLDNHALDNTTSVIIIWDQHQMILLLVDRIVYHPNSHSHTYMYTYTTGKVHVMLA